jgi:hypothetical protein
MQLIAEIFRRAAVGNYADMLQEVVDEPIDMEAFGRQLASIPAYRDWLAE